MAERNGKDKKFQVRKNNDGTKTIQYRYRIEDKQYTKSIKTEDKTTFAEKRAMKEIEKFAKDMEAKKTLGLAKNETNMDFKSYALQLFEIRNINKKNTTIDTINSALRSLYKDLGEIRLKDFTPTRLDKYLMELYKQGRSSSYIEMRKNLLNQVFSSASKKDLIPSNPLEKIDFTITKDQVEKQPYNPEEIELILEYFSSKKLYRKYFNFCEIALNTGMRRGEILALKKYNIDLSTNGFIKVVDNWTILQEVTSPKTKKSTRFIPIRNYLKNIIINTYKWNEECKSIYGSDYQDNELLICQDDGRYILHQSLTKAFQIASKKLGFKVTAHRFRHTFATRMRSAEIKDLQQMLGHNLIEMTVNKYQHHDGYKQETLDLLDKIPRIN